VVAIPLGKAASSGRTYDLQAQDNLRSEANSLTIGTIGLPGEGMERLKVRAPCRGAHLISLLLRRDFGGQIPRNLKTGCHLAHGRLFPAFLHRFSPLPRLREEPFSHFTIAGTKMQWIVHKNGQMKYMFSGNQ
jgi:hypothetical protein